MNIFGFFDSDSGMLRVYLRFGPSEDQLVFHSNSSGSRWTNLSQSIAVLRPFQVYSKPQK